jgi:hypothetical protein
VAGVETGGAVNSRFRGNDGYAGSKGVGVALEQSSNVSVPPSTTVNKEERRDWAKDPALERVPIRPYRVPRAKMARSVYNSAHKMLRTFATLPTVV